jgi:ABC-type glycerol-3-phosphate transport system substrate-binding protein
MSVRKRISTAALPLILLVVLGATACGGTSSGASGGGSGSVSLVAYSTPQEAYEEIIPAFRRSEAGDGVEFGSPTALPVIRRAPSRPA